jgi:hypothetical protein
MCQQPAYQLTHFGTCGEPACGSWTGTQHASAAACALTAPGAMSAYV